MSRSKFNWTNPRSDKSLWSQTKHPPRYYLAAVERRRSEWLLGKRIDQLRQLVQPEWCFHILMPREWDQCIEDRVKQLDGISRSLSSDSSQQLLSTLTDYKVSFNLNFTERIKFAIVNVYFEELDLFENTRIDFDKICTVFEEYRDKTTADFLQEAMQRWHPEANPFKREFSDLEWKALIELTLTESGLDVIDWLNLDRDSKKKLVFQALDALLKNKRISAFAEFNLRAKKVLSL